jgi:hypothetical protein
MTRSFASCTSSLLALLSVACGYDDGGRVRVDPDAAPVIVQGSIDTDQTMTDLTTGIGAFVEYTTGGNWKLQVSCDTATSHQDCDWDIVAVTSDGSPFYSSQAIALESSDLLTIQSDGQLRLQTTTSGDLDGVSFVADSGAPVTFDIVLDGVSNPEQYFYYISGGAVVAGAGSSVIELTPTAP